MSGQRQVDIPLLAEFQAIAVDDPIGCAAALAPHADRLGHRFPRPYARLRRQCLERASVMVDPDTDKPYTQAKLARLVGPLHPTRIGQILRRYIATTSANNSAIAPAGRSSA